MFENGVFVLGWCYPPFEIAQIPVIEEVVIPEQTELVFSSPQFLVALLAGVVMAFAFQLLLTNFSVALGISSLGGNQSDSDDESESLGGTIRKIETAVGLWTLVTVTIALFIACFLAVKLSLVNSTVLGAIIAVVIWSTYFSLLVWVGSTAVGTLIGSVVSTATSGFQGVMGTTAVALGASAAQNQAVSTAEAVTAAVRRELTSGIDPNTIQKTLQSSLGSVQLPSLNLNEIRSQFEKILSGPELQSIAGSDLLRNIDRQTFVDLISSRTDFSKQDINRIADQLEGAWKQVVGEQPQQEPQAELLNFLKSASPEELRSDQLSTKLEQLIETRQDNEKQSPGLMNRALQSGLSTLIGTVLSRTDLSDLDAEKISGQLQNLKDKATEQTNKLGSQVAQQAPDLPFNTIKADVENYLLNSQPWHLNRETIKQEFRDVIYDPEAAPGVVRRQLEQLNRDYFVQLLNQGGNFTPDRVAEIADELEGIQKEVLTTVQNAEAQEQSEDLRSRVENYLRSTGKEELNPESIGRDFKTLLEDPEAGFEGLRDRLSQFDRDTLVQLLKERQDISDEEAEQIVNQLEGTRDSVLSQAQELQEQAKSQAQELRQKVEAYLRDTNKEELNPEGIKRELQTLLDDPQAGARALRERLSQFDRDTLVQLLSQRQDLSEEEVNQVLDQFKAVRDNILQAPQKLAGKVKEQSQNLRSRVENYLRSTGKEELNPEGIGRDFKTLLEDPEAGFEGLRDRLSQFDRDTFVQLLKERQDISDEEAEQIVNQLEGTRDSVLSQAQELQEQAKAQANELRQKVEAYLSDTNKEELNPEGIKRELRTLLDDPQAGVRALRERLSQFDRDTLVQLLSQRQDLSEEQINQVIDQFEAVRDNILQAPQRLAGQAKDQYEQVSTKIAEYLGNTNLEELNPEGIKRDLTKLLDDPRGGASALRDRLSQVDRETLVKLLSQREDLSEEQVNRAIDQVQEAIRSIIKAPRRLAKRATQQVRDFEANLESYLRNTHKEELNPEGIKRDLQILLNDPRSGVGNIRDRLSQFDRSTLVASLSQREDITEEEANRIADQIESVRNSFVEQLQKVQQSIQSVIDGIFGRVRDYLNSLERPELNYESIKQDFQKLFDDPQAGLEALRGRLSQFDRDTLVAVLSSREDISQEDANRIIAQIEGARDNVLQQAERIQQEAQKRLDALKQQAKKQAEETKKAAAGAAWWLFSTALTSLAASAIAGVIAVAGITAFFG